MGRGIFFWFMSLSVYGIAWSEKQNGIPLGPELEAEGKQASINTWEIGFIPFFRTNVRV
jgi:hypothetical protein